MHEMGIASSILEAVAKEELLYPGHRAVKVDVRIGKFAGVDAGSLRFCFEAIVKDTPRAALQLGIVPCLGDELDLGWMELEEIEVDAGEGGTRNASARGAESTQ
jgi:hypothetical protein